MRNILNCRDEEEKEEEKSRRSGSAPSVTFSAVSAAARRCLASRFRFPPVEAAGPTSVAVLREKALFGVEKQGRKREVAGERNRKKKQKVRSESKS